MANTLFLVLEAPLQSWGERARWSVRDSASEPTKSGVVGLLACALGWSTDEELRALSELVQMGVRCDRPGQPLVDYHTVEGGVLSAEGKVKINAKTHAPETVVSHRTYLCDASFLIAVQSVDPGLIETLARAVQNPIWPVYLGRKSCPPACPIFAGTGDYPSLKDALSAKSAHPANGAGSIEVRVVLESEPGQGVRRREQVLSRSRRLFGPRYIQEDTVTVPVEAKEA